MPNKEKTHLILISQPPEVVAAYRSSHTNITYIISRLLLPPDYLYLYRLAKSRVSRPPREVPTLAARVLFFVVPSRPNTQKHLLIIRKTHFTFQLRILLSLETVVIASLRSARCTATGARYLRDECRVTAPQQLPFSTVVSALV